MSKISLSAQSSIASFSDSSLHISTSNINNYFVKALYDFCAKEQDELTLEEQDVVCVLTSQPPKGGWLFGEINGSSGWFPATYVRRLTDEEIISEGLLSNTLLLRAPSFKQRPSSQPISVNSETLRETNEEGSASTETDESGPHARTGWFGIGRHRKPSFNKNTRIMSRTESVASTEGAGSDRSRAGSAVPSADTNQALSNNTPTSQQINHVISQSAPSLLSSSPVDKKPFVLSKPISSKLQSSKGAKGAAVAILGSPADSKPRWQDFVGGAEAVEKLNLSKQDRQRQEVIYEIITTEKDYVEDLEILIEVIFLDIF
jgi:hypothetical protein